ncbi:MAG: 50S ribosomal protein L9 [Candidatus Schekmanbacteria bacterium]|nr:50S ribosomal protein L9 [Candidatus Schekmanbacteria bacterium]
MEVILREAVPGLGEPGQQVKVAPGYGRNYLIPKGIAVHASASNLKMLERERELQALREQKALKEAKRLATKIKKTSLTIAKEVGEQDKLYGSVTSKDILEQLAREGIKLDKNAIDLKDPIKSLGVFSIPIRLHAEVKAKLQVWVVRP